MDAVLVLNLSRYPDCMACERLWVCSTAADVSVTMEFFRVWSNV